MITPFVRYALIALSSYLVTKGLSPELANEFTTPDMIEAISGIVMAIGTIVWYLYSKSRTALVNRSH